MKLNTNIMALQTATALGRANKTVGKASARLSSGIRLNTAADGGAEISIVTKMNLRLTNVSKAAHNAADAASLIQTAEGVLSEIRNMVQRMRELSVQAANDTLTESDRDKIQEEIDNYKEEITDSARRSEYNGIKLLGGEAGDIQSITNNARIMKISDTVKPGEYDFNVNVSSTGGISVTLLSGFSNTSVASVDGKVLTISDVDNRKIILDLTHSKSGDTKLKIEEKSLVFQVGASKGMETKVNIPRVSAETLEIEGICVSDWQNANMAIEQCDLALSDLATISARLGAYINRFGFTLTNLETTEFNLESSLSRINDADMSKEMIEYAKTQVLVQADVSLLAQANQRPQQLLTLIQ